MPRLPLLLPRELDESEDSSDDEAFMPSLELLEGSDWDERSVSAPDEVFEELFVEPFDEALRPPERSCELPRPELVFPDAPRPSLRSLLSPMLLAPRSLSLEVSVRPCEAPYPEPPDVEAASLSEVGSVRVTELSDSASPCVRPVRLGFDEPVDPDDPDVAPADWLRSP